MFAHPFLVQFTNTSSIKLIHIVSYFIILCHTPSVNFRFSGFVMKILNLYCSLMNRPISIGWHINLLHGFHGLDKNMTKSSFRLLYNRIKIFICPKHFFNFPRKYNLWIYILQLIFVGPLFIILTLFYIFAGPVSSWAPYQ